MGLIKQLEPIHRNILAVSTRTIVGLLVALSGILVITAGTKPHKHWFYLMGIFMIVLGLMTFLSGCIGLKNKFTK